MSGIVFVAECEADGGPIARPLAQVIFAEGDSYNDLREQAGVAMQRRFEGVRSTISSLQYVEDEVLSP